MSLLCLIGIHTYGKGYVKFSQPLQAGKFDTSHAVEHVQNCEVCGKSKITKTYLYTEEDFNLVPRKEIDTITNKQIKELLSNSNLSVQEVAKETGVSISTVRRRLQKLKNQ